MDILDVAEWFLQQKPMSHKKIQKMCYYAVAWGYALYDKQMFENDEFEAWQHGPVSPVLYEKYRGKGWNEIPPEGRKLVVNSEQYELLDDVMYTYGENTANSLEALSHIETPWLEARAGLDKNERGNRIISTKTMHDYYLSIYDGSEE